MSKTQTKSKPHYEKPRRKLISSTREDVRILGRLGDYYTHSGYRIAPIIGLVSPPLKLVPHPTEVAEIIEIPLSYLLRSDSYRLRRHPFIADRAHFSVIYGDATINGPTISVLIGFYEDLAKTHS